jgi:hypothetical protein
VDALRNPVRFTLTAAQVDDILQAEDAISVIGGLNFTKASGLNLLSRPQPAL